MFVKDVSSPQFEREVVARSHQVPVVVDFWAGWCAPCRMLGPVLEREVNALGGRVELAKVDVDQAQDLAAAFQVQGIPAVKAFRSGAVVAEFAGARDAAFVRSWLGALAPSEARQALERATTAQALRPLLDDPEVGIAAAVRLAGVLLKANQPTEALTVLEAVPMHHALHDEAHGLRMQAQLALSATALGDEATLRQRLAVNPGDADALYALGCLTSARGDDEAALAAFLDVVSLRKTKRDEARRAMVTVFEKLGPQHPLTSTWRRRLQAVL